jgi:Protein of unknown function (DUF3617)
MHCSSYVQKALGLLAIAVSSVATAQISNADYQAWAKATGFKPGMYEYKMTIEMSGIPGMGTMKMPPSSFKKCVTQKDVDEGRQMMNDPKSGGFKCTMTSFSANGDKGQYAQTCEGSSMTMSVVGSFEQKGDTQIHSSKTAMQGKGMNTTSNNVMEIRRLGDCS